MSQFQLSKRSHQRLDGVHPDLQSVVRLAITLTDVDFCVTEGARTAERQLELVAKGASTTTNSRHIPKKAVARPELGPVSHAVDLAAMIGAEVRWDWPLYHKLADAMKAAAAKLKVSIVWGGDWKTFKDGPHFELDRQAYP
ncbi:M15 family peptidase [Pseudomonas sp. L-22-4S-12]|uniref:M15 family metallopeptidase n=1 Tax=Pseudomonas sp. L-22-4S-12 TaxID=2610893 RepID=UPI001322EED9|nr:M15 family metallopeptidase [Pseudomonas sp. L-22-4S-12]MWV17550.1 M15 family peptidase [Pseudomonas sp. L-22-4S-12]